MTGESTFPVEYHVRNLTDLGSLWSPLPPEHFSEGLWGTVTPIFLLASGKTSLSWPAQPKTAVGFQIRVSLTSRMEASGYAPGSSC